MKTLPTLVAAIVLTVVGACSKEQSQTPDAKTPPAQQPAEKAPADKTPPAEEPGAKTPAAELTQVKVELPEMD